MHFSHDSGVIGFCSCKTELPYIVYIIGFCFSAVCSCTALIKYILYRCKTELPYIVYISSVLDQNAQLQNNKGEWKPLRLFLSTDTTLTAEQVLESYGLRWSIETLFNQLKLHWGLKEAWQLTRQTLHRWVHITMVGYGLLQLLTCIKSDHVEQLCQLSPWRSENTITAGQVRKGLARILLHVPVQSWLGITCNKLKFDKRALYNASDGKIESAV